MESVYESVWPVQVEILLLGLWDPSSGNLFAEEGDQQRFWKITRKFIEQITNASGVARVKAVRPLLSEALALWSKYTACAWVMAPRMLSLQLYPDMGVAAMLRNEWKDRSFEIAAISDRKAVSEDDELVVIAAVDPQGAKSAHPVEHRPGAKPWSEFPCMCQHV